MLLSTGLEKEIIPFFFYFCLFHYFFLILSQNYTAHQMNQVLKQLGMVGFQYLWIRASLDRKRQENTSHLHCTCADFAFAVSPHPI